MVPRFLGHNCWPLWYDVVHLHPVQDSWWILVASSLGRMYLGEHGLSPWNLETAELLLLCLAVVMMFCAELYVCMNTYLPSQHVMSRRYRMGFFTLNYFKSYLLDDCSSWSDRFWVRPGVGHCLLVPARYGPTDLKVADVLSPWNCRAMGTLTLGKGLLVIVRVMSCVSFHRSVDRFKYLLMLTTWKP